VSHLNALPASFNLRRAGAGSAIRDRLLAGAAVLAMAATFPALAQAAPSCSPASNGGGPGAGGRTPASGHELCAGGDVGVWFRAVGGDLTVDLDNDALSTNGINILDDGHARNITVNDGLAGSYAAAPISGATGTGPDGLFAGVDLQSSGGDVVFSSISGGKITGSGGQGAGVAGRTTGAGNVTLTLGDTVTDLEPNSGGVGGIVQNGTLTINAGADVTGGADAIFAEATGTGSIQVVAGSSANPVTVASAHPGVNDAVDAFSQGGDVSVTTFGSAVGELLGTTTGSGAVTITANGTVAVTGSDDAAIFAKGLDGTVSVTVNGDLTNGLVAYANGKGAVNVQVNGNINEAVSTTPSIFAASITGDVAVAVSGDLSTGLYASTSGSGQVTVSVAGNVTEAAPIDAIDAASVDGAASVTVASGTVSSSTGAYGVHVRTYGAGAASAVLGSGVTIDPPTVGVFVQSEAGTASITAGDGVAVTAADTDQAGGLTARSDWAATSGQLTAQVITGSADVISVTGDDSAGITAVNAGSASGGVSVQTGAGNQITVTGNTVTGIVAATSAVIPVGLGAAGFDGTGAVSLRIGANNTIRILPGTDNGGLAPASAGVLAASDGGNVDLEWSGAGGSVSVSGQPGVFTAGVVAISGPGPTATISPLTSVATVTVVTGQGTTIDSASGAGVLAINANFGQTTVVTGGPVSTASGPQALSSLITLIAGPSSASAIGPAGDNAIGVLAVGLGDVSVTTNGAVTSNGGSGVVAWGGLGTVAVTANAPVVATGGVGLLAADYAGDARITTNADVYASQSAILASAGTTLSIVNSASLSGGGGASSPVIQVTGAAVSLVNNASGTIRSNAGLASDLILSTPETTPAPISVSNAGLMAGRVDLSGSSVAFVSNSGTWSTLGTSLFPGGPSVLTNTGAIKVGGAASFQNLPAFNNAGVVDLRNAAGVPGDVLTVGGAFNGAAGSQLIVNAKLGTTGSGAGCGALSDCLVVASSSGVTRILVHDTGAASDAGPNSGGVLVVSGASSGSNFVLDPGSTGYDAKTGLIREGLFAYGLGFSPTDQQVRLYGAPDASARELPELATALQAIWYAASPDLEPPFAAESKGDPRGLWLQGLGAVGRRNVEVVGVTPGGSAASVLGLGYDQDVYGLVGGFEIGNSGLSAPGDAWNAGVMAGYVGSQVDFDAEAAKARFSGALVGIYGSYVRGGWFVSAEAKAALLELRHTTPGAGGFSIDPNAHAWGGRIYVGERKPFGHGLYFQPTAAVALVSGVIDDSQAYGVGVHFGANDSLRVGGGLEVGGQSASGRNILDWSLGGKLWDETLANNHVAIAAGGTPLELVDRFGGPFGEVAANLRIHAPDDRWAGFVSAGGEFKDGYAAGRFSVGVKIQW
jgi:hypothetical protein